MSFWPDEINADPVLSPRDIMKDAGTELENRTGKLMASIQESVLPDRVVLAFLVVNRDSQATFNLFEVSHQIGQSYPVLLIPPESDIPEFLNRQRYVRGSPGIFGALAEAASLQESVRGTPGRYVENRWVCATPSEFKAKLTELLAKDFVKSRIISLLASPRIEGVREKEPETTEQDPLGAGQ